MNTKENYIKTAIDLIKFKTITGDIGMNNKAIEYIKDYLKDFNIQKFESNNYKSLLITNTDNHFKQKFKLILNGHLDVVPGNDSQFLPVIKDNRLFGRGAYDMKAAVAVQMEVFKRIANDIKIPVALQLVTDEEIGGFDGTMYQLQQGVSGGFVIGGEPTNFSIRYKAKGVLWVKFTTRGKSIHSSQPWNGINANSRMIAFLTSLESMISNPKSDKWVTTMNIAKLYTKNDTFNIIPDSASAKVDIRFIPDDKDILCDIKLLAKEMSIETEVIMDESCHYTDPLDSSLDMLSEINQSLAGLNKREALIGANGGSDLRFYTKRLNAPSVEFGPIGNGHHSDNEWVDIDSLEVFYNILKQFILKLDIK